MRIAVPLFLAILCGCGTSAHHPWPLNEEALARTIVRSPTYQRVLTWGATPHFFIEDSSSTPTRCVVWLGTVQEDTISRVATLGFRPDGSIERVEVRPDGEEEWILEVGAP